VCMTLMEKLGGEGNVMVVFVVSWIGLSLCKNYKFIFVPNFSVVEQHLCCTLL
jgi:hypothetical protein